MIDEQTLDVKVCQLYDKHVDSELLRGMLETAMKIAYIEGYRDGSQHEHDNTTAMLRRLNDQAPTDPR